MTDLLTMIAVIGIPVALMLAVIVRYFSIKLIYLNTRFNVIGNPNMSSTRLADALATGDRVEAAKRLSTRYFPIEDSAGIDDAESRMMIVNRELLEETLHVVPKRVRPFFDVMMMSHEIDRVRSACAALEDGADVMVETVGRIDAGIAEAMSRCSTTSEIISTYLETIGETVDGPADADLDAAYLRTMARAAGRLKGISGRPLRDILLARIDSELVLLALRMHLHDSADRLSELDIPEGDSVAPWMLADIAADPAKGVASLAGTDLDGISGLGDPVAIERALRRTTFDMAERVYTRRFMSIGPLTRFLLFREFETANVRAVLMGAAAGLEWPTVESATITEEAA